MKIQPIVNQPVIETARFDLRPLRRSDLGLIELHAGDERVARNTTSIPHPLPPGTIEAFISRAMTEPRDFDCWAMDGTKENGAEVMGLITLSRLDRN
ncbi:MAG: GNAT family N-acetyltransferase, partial [Sulfitobacter geojensis]